MDAMQKRRMLKVAMIHFFTTVIVFIFGMSAFSVLWQKFWFQIGLLVQPQLSLILFIPDPPPPGFSYLTIGEELLGIIGLISILIIPFWSFCFGWLYVKFTNWLNHFPVLGKKVF